MPDHLDALLESPTQSLAVFQNTFSGKNCPATAAAVDRFLGTGEATPARRLLTGGGFINCGSPFTQAPLPRIARRVREGGHGFHLVIAAYGGRRASEHYANVANIRGTAYYIDAYTSPAVLTERMAVPLNWATTFEFTERFEPRFVPQGSRPVCR